MSGLLARVQGRHAGEYIAHLDVFARPSGCHRRRSSYTGWAVVMAAPVRRVRPVLDFVGRRRAALTLAPVSDELIPFGPAPRTHPYPSKENAA